MNKAMTAAVALVGAAFGFSASAGVVCKGGAGGSGIVIIRYKHVKSGVIIIVH